MMIKKKKRINQKKLQKRLQNKRDKEWAIAVKEAYLNKCAICGKKELINAHHIIPRENRMFRWEIDNGIALCPKHHRFSLELSPHRNSFEFYRWWGQNYMGKCKKLIELIYEKRNTKTI